METLIKTNYKQHFDNAPIPIWIIDAQSMRFLEVNYAAIEKYGYSRADFSRMTIMDIRPPEDVDSVIENYRKRESDYYDAGYRRHLKRDGTVFYVHIYSHSTQYGDIPARLCFAVDVNDKVLTEQKNLLLLNLLNDQKEELDGILNSLSEAIWSRDAETNKLLYGNKAYFDMYGVVQGGMDPDISYVLNSVFPPDRELIQNSISEVVSNGKSEIVYRHINKDGSLRTLKVQAKFKKGIEGQQDMITGITTDITQEKRAHRLIV